MSLIRNIIKIGCIALGLLLLFIAGWILFTSKQLFIACLIAGGGGIMLHTGLVLRKSWSLSNLLRESLSSGLIFVGTVLFMLALLSLNFSHLLLTMLYALIAVAIGSMGWLLRKLPKPMSQVQNIASGILIMVGLALFMLPIFILALYGTDIAYANIALIHFILGLLIGLNGVSIRNKAH